MITLADYYKGRDKEYAIALTEEMKLNAIETVRRANLLIAASGLILEAPYVTSGWRPPGINANIPGAAVRSKHLTCQAIDLFDPDGEIDDWCMDNLDKLEQAEIWLEHPSSTKGWSHWQIIPPKSGRRVFYP